MVFSSSHFFYTVCLAVWLRLLCIVRGVGFRICFLHSGKLVPLVCIVCGHHHHAGALVCLPDGD